MSGPTYLRGTPSRPMATPPPSLIVSVSAIPETDCFLIGRMTTKRSKNRRGKTTVTQVCTVEKFTASTRTTKFKRQVPALQAVASCKSLHAAGGFKRVFVWKHNDMNEPTFSFKLNRLNLSAAWHPPQVNCISFNPDGSLIAAGSDDNLVRVWELEKGTLINTFKGHTGEVRSVAFTPSSRLVSGSDDGSVRLWDVANGAHRILKSHTHPVKSVACTSGWVAYGTSSDVHLYDIANPSKKQTFDHPHTVDSVSFSPDGQRLAVGGGHTVRVWRVLDEKMLFKTHSRWPVTSVAFLQTMVVYGAGPQPHMCKWGTDGAWQAVSTGTSLRLRL